MFWLYAKLEIRPVRALKGRRVGASGIGSGPDSLLREILRQNGLDASRDVAVLTLGVMPTIFSGLQSGTVDAAMLSPPVTFKAEEAGFRELVAFPKQDLIQLQGSILVRDASLQSDPAQLERFIRGTYKRFLYIKDNRAGTIPIWRDLYKSAKAAPLKIRSYGRHLPRTELSTRKCRPKRSNM